MLIMGQERDDSILVMFQITEAFVVIYTFSGFRKCFSPVFQFVNSLDKTNVCRGKELISTDEVNKELAVAGDGV